MQENFKIKTEPEAVSTSGLDLFFEVTGQTDDSVTSPSSQSDTREVSVAEAAELLGITERSVWRRIRQGKISSKLVGGKAILTIQQSDIIRRQTDRQSDTSDCQPEHITDVSVVPDNSKALELVAELAAKLEAATYRNGYLEAQLETHKEQVKLLPDYQHKATEATILKARVSELENELQLYKRGRWVRFWSWFIGK